MKRILIALALIATPALAQRTVSTDIVLATPYVPLSLATKAGQYALYVKLRQAASDACFGQVPNPTPSEVSAATDCTYTVARVNYYRILAGFVILYVPPK